MNIVIKAKDISESETSFSILEKETQNVLVDSYALSRKVDLPDGFIYELEIKNSDTKFKNTYEFKFPTKEDMLGELLKYTSEYYVKQGLEEALEQGNKSVKESKKSKKQKKKEQSQ